MRSPGTLARRAMRAMRVGGTRSTRRRPGFGVRPNSNKLIYSGRSKFAKNSWKLNICAGAKKFVPRSFQYRSDHYVFIMVVPPRGRMGSFEIRYDYMELEYLCKDKEVCPPTVPIQQ